MLYAGFPVGIRMQVTEVVVMDMFFVGQLAVFKDRLRVARVCTSHIQRDRIERSEHTHVRDDRHIVFAAAVTQRRNITYQFGRP